MNSWKAIVAKYQRSSVSRALWQLVNTLVPYVAVWYLMYLSLSVSWWLTLPLAVLAAGFLVRIFVIFHDCGHGSFFKASAANEILGFFTGVLTFTPFHHWRWQHAVHHATSGDLDRRGTGDVWTLTVQEYLEASRWKRLAYRLARNPVILFGLAPFFLFIIQQRCPSSGAGRRERFSVWWTNLGVVTMGMLMSAVFGFERYWLLQLLIIMIAGSAGVWLFYVQHQFEGVYWERNEDWDYEKAALKGASYYKLPWLLQWFSGNIGFHHIHHLSSRIPNYHLKKCHYSETLFQAVKPVSFLASFKALGFRLWDERERKLVGFRALKKLQRA